MALWLIGKPKDVCACPQCGSLDVALWNNTGTNHFWMECNQCETESDENTAFGVVYGWRVT